MKKSMLFFAVASLFSTGVLANEASPEPIRVEVRQLQMGVMATLTVYAPDLETGRRACAAAFERVHALNTVFSDYDSESELGRLMARAGEGPVPVSAELFSQLAQARLLAEQTGGRLDLTVGPLVRLWRQARLQKKPPEPAALEEARQRTGYAKMHLDSRTQTAALDIRGMRLDLGAFAKGYAGDEALAVLRSNGFPRAMFEAGGDMVFGDPPPGLSGWPVNAPHPSLQRMELSNCAIGISGDTVQFFEMNGRRYSHVVDPATGYGLTNHLMCIVVADRGRLSDPLSTAGTLMPEKDYREMLKQRYPGVRAWVFPAPEESSPAPAKWPEGH